MQNVSRLAAILAVSLLCTSFVQATEWQTISGENPAGKKFVSMNIQQDKFALEFHCDESDWQDNRLGVKFFGPPLPNLDEEDGATAKLSFLFSRRDGVLYREAWEPYYFNGGPGDQAWLGTINAGKSELDALAAALKLDILNVDAELLYSFETVGTAAGVRAIREVCKLGLE